MEAELQSHIAFHLTGKRPNDGLELIAGQNMRPALMAQYRDLAALRHDFPVVLVEGAEPASCIQSLSAVIDGLAAKLVVDLAPERTAMHLRRLERAIRVAVLEEGARGTLNSLWHTIAAKMTAAGDDPAFADSLERAHTLLKFDGAVVGCDAELPQSFVTHAWQAVEAARAKRFRKEIGALIARLADVLRADFSLSPQGRTPENLRSAMANAFSDELDFDALSGVLSKLSAKVPVPEARLKRVREVLAILQRQRFVSLEGVTTEGTPKANLHSFLFENSAKALAAYRERLPEIVGLVRAMSIARLELRSDYVPERHDPFFRDFSAQMLGEDELALFPGYLVRLRAADLKPGDNSELMELLGAGLPVKFLLQIDDILEPSIIGDGRLAFRAGAKQLAKMALGLHDVYVMQASGSGLFKLRDQMMAGLASYGPGLLSVFSGDSGTTGGISPYLVGAAATESRAFPTFWYDPSAGADWASRFSLANNPQAAADWATHDMRYEDGEHQRIDTKLRFTMIDFVASDSRYAAHFAGVSSGKWEEDLFPAAEALGTRVIVAGSTQRSVPYIMMVDDQNAMRRVIVDEKMMIAAEHCLRQWHSLQELGGLHNSHAKALVERERTAWSAAQAALDAARSVAAPAVAAATAAAPAAASAPAASQAPAAEEPERADGEAYIDTGRCSSCDECTTINPKMFAYDNNRQAYIVDVKLGTFRQLVEAAEGCALSIIHPGVPVNKDEPGLEDLIERAAPFQ
jgi:ferredoxin